MSALAGEVAGLLEQNGFTTARDSSRGFDHGAFVPLKVTYPEAEVPAIQLSLMEGLNPASHLALGRALRPQPRLRAHLGAGIDDLLP